MTAPIDCILVLMILTNFLLLGSSRLLGCIKTAAFQGILVALLPVVVTGSNLTFRLIAICITIAALKGFVFPHLLSTNLRSSNTSREVQPLVGYTTSIVVGVLSLAISFWLDSKLLLPIGSNSQLVVPVAFSMLFTGLFLIIARRTAINQVLGYLILEDGIYSFGFAIVGDIPVLIELGVLMDLFVAVFVM